MQFTGPCGKNFQKSITETAWILWGALKPKKLMGQINNFAFEFFVMKEKLDILTIEKSPIKW